MALYLKFIVDRWDSITSDLSTYILTTLLIIVLVSVFFSYFFHKYYAKQISDLKVANETLNERLNKKDDDIKRLNEQNPNSSENKNLILEIQKENKSLRVNLSSKQKKINLKDETLELITEIREFIKEIYREHDSMESLKKLRINSPPNFLEPEKNVKPWKSFKLEKREEFERKFRSRYEVKLNTILSILGEERKFYIDHNFNSSNEPAYLQAMIDELEVMANRLEFLEDNKSH